MLRIMTAGESHGKCLIGIIEGLPSNFTIDIDAINRDLARRQRGYGRGPRMEIEDDRIEILSGIRGGKTLGSPIAFTINNKDYENWQPYMQPIGAINDDKRVTKPRPGHADLSGIHKYNFNDIRNVLERSSARETAVRVAAGSIIKDILKTFNIKVYSHVTAVGGIKIEERNYDIDTIKLADESPIRCIEKTTEAAIINRINEAKEAGESLGGRFEIHITGAPIGLGSYVHWDRKLDARLAYSLMSIQGIKSVEIGYGIEGSNRLGSEVHDEIFYDTQRGYYRKTNRSGGIEGGMSNGENIVVSCGMKPIPTLYKPLKSVDIDSKEAVEASVERSDTCAVAAASVVGEMVVISVIGEEFFRKFGGDSKEEIIRRWKEYELT